MTKPIGPLCNLDCTYCYYLEKEALYATKKWQMSDETLEAYILQYIESQPTPEVHFAWQGGEPTLLGLDYFKRIVALQRKYANGRRITNAMQTNGTKLDDDWGGFLRDESFLIGLSIDGPEELHDHYRVDKGGKGSFHQVMAGLECLQRNQVEFNTLTVLNRVNSQHPARVYRFLKSTGSTFLQFIPIVERRPDAVARELGLDHALPPNTEAVPLAEKVTEESVLPEDFGDFMVTMFDEWVRRDVGTIFVQLFDHALSAYMGQPPALCIFSKTCGKAMAMEHNGDVFSCDHYVYPQYKLGNINEIPLLDLATDPRQDQFGKDKWEQLPDQCRNCNVLPMCHGECPKHRFLKTASGQPNLNYLCAGYYRFFNHSLPYMKEMADLLHRRRPASDIMVRMAQRDRTQGGLTVGRNEPCPCGSGRKYKQCCGKN